MSIKLEHLNYIYSPGTAYEKQALKDICLEIPHGEFAGIIGHTGSGKSTLIQHFNGLIRATSGKLYYNGEDIYADGYDRKKLRSQVGLVFQYPEHQLFEVDVMTDVCFGPKNQGLSAEECKARAREALELVGLKEKYYGSSPFELSGGQKRRAAIAGVLAMRPKVLVLDEPTTFLDIRHKLELLTILRELVRNRGIGAVISLHELDLALRLSDYVVCVDGDRIGRLGPPEEILTSSYIEALYGIETGSYDALLGGAEFPPVKGKPKVFVIGGNGSGIAVYRRLHRQNIPFAAGILHENDIDYSVAGALAAETVTEEAFEPIREETYRKAEKLARSCEEVICCLTEFGAMNEANRRLAQIKI